MSTKEIAAAVKEQMGYDIDKKKIQLSASISSSELAPVFVTGVSMAVSRVPRDTRNLVGMSGDHPVRLKDTSG